MNIDWYSTCILEGKSATQKESRILSCVMEDFIESILGYKDEYARRLHYTVKSQGYCKFKRNEFPSLC